MKNQQIEPSYLADTDSNDIKQFCMPIAIAAQATDLDKQHQKKKKKKKNEKEVFENKINSLKKEIKDLKKEYP